MRFSLVSTLGKFPYAIQDNCRPIFSLKDGEMKIEYEMFFPVSDFQIGEALCRDLNNIRSRVS